MGITFEQAMDQIESEIAKAERLPDAADDLQCRYLILAPVYDDAGNEFNPNAWEDNKGIIYPGYFAKVSGYVYTVIFRQLPLQSDDRIAYVARSLAQAAERHERKHALTPVRH